MSLHYCVTKQWSYRKKRSTQLLIGWLTRPLPGCWEVIGRDRGGGHLQVLVRGDGVFRFSSHVRDHKVLCVCVCVCLCVCVCVCRGGGHWDQLPIKRMGQRKQRQETGSWKRKLHPLSLHNNVPMATASGVGSQQRDRGSSLARSPFKRAL